MRAFIELSGEHPTLPRAEALAALAAERVEIRSVSFNRQVLRLDAVGAVERATRRLGLAHIVCEELASGDFEAIRTYARETDLGGVTFRVRARGLGIHIDPEEVEGPIGADFGRTGRVDLERPHIAYRLLVGDEFLLGRVIHRIDRSRLEATKVAHRPFSLPISLHPKYARALVNLARVPMAGTVLDPFCGTGGILFEIAEVGLRAIGMDRDRAMVFGVRRSFPANGAADLVVADAGHLPLRNGLVDGIATDPPYGRAASTRGEPVERLYARAFSAFAGLLRVGAHVAIVLPNEAMISGGPESFDLIEEHALPVHRSLVRRFCVYVKV